MTQVDPGINLKNPKKQEAVPKWYQNKYVPIWPISSVRGTPEKVDILFT
jgi:hypothetical protein